MTRNGTTFITSIVFKRRMICWTIFNLTIFSWFTNITWCFISNDITANCLYYWRLYCWIIPIQNRWYYCLLCIVIDGRDRLRNFKKIITLWYVSKKLVDELKIWYLNQSEMHLIKQHILRPRTYVVPMSFLCPIHIYNLNLDIVYIYG